MGLTHRCHHGRGSSKSKSHHETIMIKAEYKVDTTGSLYYYYVAHLNGIVVLVASCYVVLC